jgi:hypothetical protein
MLPSISLPFFFVTTIQRVLTRSRSFFLPSTLLIVQTCVYCFTALSPPPTTASEVSSPSICSNAPADVPDLYPTFSIPISLSSDLVSAVSSPCLLVLLPLAYNQTLVSFTILPNRPHHRPSPPNTRPNPSTQQSIQWYSETSGSIRILLRTLHMDNNP